MLKINKHKIYSFTGNVPVSVHNHFVLVMLFSPVMFEICAGRVLWCFLSLVLVFFLNFGNGVPFGLNGLVFHRISLQFNILC
jgi:hypothetical protein